MRAARIMGTFVPVTPELVERIERLLRFGVSQREIAERLQTSQSTISRVRKSVVIPGKPLRSGMSRS